MKILVVHQALADDAGPDEADVLVQVEAVSQALMRLGHETSVLPLSMDLETGRRELKQRAPELIFNLVESLGGSGRLIHFAPTLFDVLGIPYTGCSSASIYETSNKILAKERLETAGLPTPGWYAPGSGRFEPGAYIIKSVVEHASIGLLDDAVVNVSAPTELDELLEARRDRLGGFAFAERYIEGRELNVAVLAGRVLRPDEILFVDYPPEKPRIVGYESKWTPGSLAYERTVASAEFPPEDGTLLDQLSSLARSAWDLFRLSGFARVDFRADELGRPFILEVNANPCISPDAGFARALSRAGISYDEAIRTLVDDVAVGAART
jgi:D-alanine-D-alanine ligase